MAKSDFLCIQDINREDLHNKIPCNATNVLQKPWEVTPTKQEWR